MNFKEAYKEIFSGKKISKKELTLFSENGPLEVKYLAKFTLAILQGPEIVKVESEFIVATDINDALHRLTDQNIISLFMSEDDDWVEYVEPISIPNEEIVEIEKE